MSAKFDKRLLQEVLFDLGLSAPSIRVYLYLLGIREASAKQIASSLGMARPSVYDQLKALSKNGLTYEFSMENKKYFRAESAKRLVALLRDKKRHIETATKTIEEMLPAIEEMEHPGLEPRIKFYPGKEGFLQVLTDAMFFREGEVLAMWPVWEMYELIGREHLKEFTDYRVVHGSRVRSIWAHEQKIPQLDIPNEETRIAPKGNTWQMGYLLYGDRVSFIASRKESFAFTVFSHDFAELIKVQFESLWNVSKVV